MKVQSRELKEELSWPTLGAYFEAEWLNYSIAMSTACSAKEGTLLFKTSLVLLEIP